MDLKLVTEIKNNGIAKVEDFLNHKEILRISKIIKHYSAPKDTPKSYFPTSLSTLIMKILKLDFTKLYHSLEILSLRKKKKLDRLADTFFENKSCLSFIDAYYSKASKSDVLPWHTDQAYSGKELITKFNNPDRFYLKIFIYLTDVGPDNGCMSYIPESHKIGYAIRKGIYSRNIQYQPYWALKDFKQIIIDNKNYFENYFKNTKIIENFFKNTVNLDQDNKSKIYGYSAKAGSAIIFDEGGVHKGSKPSLNDRMVLRYLYSLKKN